MIEAFHHILETCVLSIEITAATFIIVAFFWGLVQYFRDWKTTTREDSFKTLQRKLGRSLLVALEVLVIADVIETITTKATFSSLAVLALLVLVRTILSWSLSLQVEGRWPWQPEQEEELRDA